MPLPALDELPQLTALSLAWRRLIDVKPVLMAVNKTSLVCCWDQSGRWQQRVVGWPDGVCRDGVPLQREAVGELSRPFICSLCSVDVCRIAEICGSKNILGLFAAAYAPRYPTEWFIASDIDCSAKKLLCFMPSSSLTCFHPGVVQ